MKRKVISIVAIILLALQSAMGQIIYTQEDQGVSPRANTSFGVMVPLQNVEYDQWKVKYVPVGEGLLLLVGLSGAYLLKKKKENK